jgi:hypothetical protein
MRLAQVIGIATLCAASLTATAEHAAATLITSLQEGVAIDLPAANYHGSQAQQVVPGVTWSSTASGSVFGYSSIYGFASNGTWSGLNMAGLNSAAGTMTFAFATPVDAVGGYLNYAPELGLTPTIAVYDADMNLLESATLSFKTGGGWNGGSFFGFDGDSDISFFALSGAYIGITDLSLSSGLLLAELQGESASIIPQGVQSAPVPEPSSFLLFGAGLLGMAIFRRRSRG